MRASRRSWLRTAAMAIVVAALGFPLPAFALGSWSAWPTGWTRQSPLAEVSEFGGNPAQLRMFKYVPEGLPRDRPLVVALHGCMQRADRYDDETGWVALAERHRFALLLPQETVNFARCFRWFDLAQSARDQGEALSIRQMIEKMIEDHGLDRKRVHVTGLSAGGAMTAVMLAAYPEVFAGGAIVAGIPYRCASNESEAQNSCGLFGRPLGAGKDMTPPQWGKLVRAASGHAGPFPRISLWHGEQDATVNPAAMNELMEQWTDVHGIDQTPDVEDQPAGHLHRRYQDPERRALVETWLVRGLGHGTPVNPGSGDGQCGREAPFVLAAGICSSALILRFWGLDD